MKTIFSSRRRYYLTMVSIFFIVVTFIAGMAGCGGPYDLTISSNEGGTVTTPGEGTFAYDEGAVVNLTAEAEEGYYFINWTGDLDTIADINAASTNITMDGSYSITANFEQIPLGQFALTISSTAGGSVTTPDEGTFTYDEGEVVNLVAAPASGYLFVNWTGNVGTIANVNSATTTITMDDNYSITANFVPGIWDWYDLDDIRDNLGSNYILMNTLDSTTDGYATLASNTANGGKGWEPIGDGYCGQQWVGGLNGTFDGQGYEIKDLFINRPDGANVGLFGAVDVGGVIENIGVVNVTVTGDNHTGGLVGVNWHGTVSDSYSIGSVAGDERVGGLVGWNSGFATVSNSYSTGSVSGGENVGGLVGRNHYGTVDSSYSTGSVNGGVHVGGLVGGNNQGTVSNSSATGSVDGSVHTFGGLVGYNGGTVSDSYATGSVTGYYEAGGLVGQNDGTVSDSYSTGNVDGGRYVGGLMGGNFQGPVSNSYSTGSVTGVDYVGGLVGRNLYGTVSNSYSIGSVTGNSYVGGLVGYDKTGGTTTNSFWDTETSGQATSDGGTGKNTTEMQDIATFSGATWDIIAVAPGSTNTTYIWNIVNNVTYPFLSWQPVS